MSSPMNLYVDPTIPRFTRRELLDDMAARGFDFSGAAMRDWQSKGLLADANQDQRWSDGRPGSDAGLWSDNQRRCLAELLGVRDRNLAARLPLSGLGNLIVWWWAYWDGIIELPQARKALRTWIRPQLGGPAGGARSPERIRKATRATVRQLAGPESRRATRSKVAARLFDLYWTDNQSGLGTLVADVQAVMDPARTGRTVGSPKQPVRPDDVARGIDAALRTAHAVVTGEPEITDDDFAVARSFLRQAWADYHRDWQILDTTAIDLAFGYEQPSVSLQMREAARSLTTVLGLRLAERAAQKS